MAFRNIITGEYPVSFHSIRLKYLNISFPDFFTEAPEHEWVYPITPEFIDPKVQYLEEGAPELREDGKWYQTWVVKQRSQEDINNMLFQEKMQFINKVVDNTQQRLDAFASTRNYSSILSAATYATSKVPKFQKEGQYCVDKRDETWATLYSILEQVEAGTIPQPSSWEEVEAMLPVLEWPE